MEEKITALIAQKLAELGRPDRYREPLVAFAAADDPGFADLKELAWEGHTHPTDHLPEARSVISYFVPFTRDLALASRYGGERLDDWAQAYVELNAHFNVINQAVMDMLEQEGLGKSIMPSPGMRNPTDFYNPWSQRSVACVCGLGEFGANNILITKKGSAGRFSSIITEAPLKPSGKKAKQRCLYRLDGSCQLCFKACPGQAFTPEGFDRTACKAVLGENGAMLAERGIKGASVCGKCIGVCPFFCIT